MSKLEIDASVTCMRLVDGDALEGLTSSGWKVFETHTETFMKKYMCRRYLSEEEATKMQTSGALYYAHRDGGSVYVDEERFHEVTITKFLVGRLEHDVVRDLNAHIGQLRQEMSALQCEKHDLEETVNPLRAELDKTKVQLDDARKDRSSENKKVVELQAKMRTYETDLGKVRSAIGAIRMKEILG